MRKIPFDKARLEEIAAKWPTPFHIYDAKAIRENAKRLKKAFAWNKGFREYFAVKAAPNPHLMKLLKEFDFGSDCSSMAELVLAEKVGNVGDRIMFTSNDTPAEEFRKAWQLGAIINLDDITHWPFVLDSVGRPQTAELGEHKLRHRRAVAPEVELLQDLHQVRVRRRLHREVLTEALVPAERLLETLRVLPNRLRVIDMERSRPLRRDLLQLRPVKRNLSHVSVLHQPRDQAPDRPSSP